MGNSNSYTSTLSSNLGNFCTTSLVFPEWGTGNPWGHSIHAEAKPFCHLLFQHDLQCSEGTNNLLSHGLFHFPWYLRHALYSCEEIQLSCIDIVFTEVRVRLSAIH